MRLRSLESRIVALFLVLVLIVQLAGFIAIHTGINENARKAVANELVIGERVFLRLMQQNADNLVTGARVLALDYGFRQAVGSDDNETITSVLENHGARIGATLTLLIGIDREIKATTATLTSAGFKQSILALVEEADHSGSANGVRLVDDKPYRIVVIPVKAPQTIGWVAMAFPIDQQLINDMHELSSLQVAIVSRDQAGAWTTKESTFTTTEAANLSERLQDFPPAPANFGVLNIAGNEYSYRNRVLAANEEHVANVLLLQSINAAVAPYDRLQLTLLILTAICTLLAVFFSKVAVRRITGPLRELTEIAKQLGKGDYEGRLEIRRKDEIGELARAFDSMRDDISRREFETNRLAYWDTLTNLPNRPQCVKLISAAVEQADKAGGHCYVLILNLDRFKNVNDVLGHQIGDDLLRKVAERLKEQLDGGTGQLARLEGDEFAIVLPLTNLRACQMVAQQILISLEQPISLDDQTVDLGAGIGIAGFPEHGTDAEALVSHAEIAMYAAKKSGNEAVVYHPAIDKSSDQNLSLLSELRHAIENNEFRLQMQPKILLDSGEVVGAEALIRWVHPERGMIFPDDFIPFAEKSGFIRTMTLWILEQSAALCSQLIARGLHLKISINLSTRDLLDQDLPHKFAAILQRHQVTAQSFCLEITESAIMDDPVRALQTLERLHAMNVELSIDDFGTGYSSLAYLKRLPVDELKIDKSFVMNMEHDRDDAQIVRSTIDLGHNMGLRVVAEGIESKEAWSLLEAMGCDQGQGYLISKPMPAEQLADWVERWVPSSRSVTPINATS
ncbi:EAL domain-containing protein [Actimicrobium sp. CCI2.3]|uniref:bifunctional diguanylate cyclase/phosphodiesterase n=1 Tax=Actimicrobium sp. CCI2.3 TaxID=3048616 RepID=UPI002AB365F2|nr:EAL domain-containing protein [Actimicrobium sp. CCI2.3]MDY7575182.1 EAL domain-containing protein [Actimicrobium sp. CCI2.3]MEB0022355.1 EAL domain-containing protein [Actimicrobium sp. CCI2.3]